MPEQTKYPTFKTHPIFVIEINNNEQFFSYNRFF
jgi:hypothetical protein